MGRLLKWLGLVALALVAIGIVAAIGGYFWLRTSLPQEDGAVTVAGLTAPVTIERDARGIPTIRAASLNDAYFGVGFAHAQDRLFQMDLMRRVGAGRLAEIVGAEGVPTDKLMRTLGIRAMAAQQTDAATPALKQALAAYTAGVNAFLTTHRGALPPEFLLLRYRPEPWTPTDSLTWGRLMALQLSSNWNAERLNLTLKQTLPPELFKLLRPEAQSFAGLPLPFGPVDEASNNWVVGPGKSKSGAPILANDPHLGLTAPSIWYLVHIVTPEREWIGATSPGMPLIVIGSSDKVAWGFTTTAGDTEDLFEEKLVPDDPKSYQTFYGKELFGHRSETIKVKGAADQTIDVRSTHHGPVVSDLDDKTPAEGSVYALAAAFLLPNDRTPEALLAMNLARSAREFQAALADFAAPQQNVAFADRDGHIGLVVAGRVPVRRKVFDEGLLPTPGWTDDYDWVGTIPFDGLPQSIDPAAGWLGSANNKIVDDNYPYFMAGSWPDDGRYKRIAELLQAQSTFDVAGFEAMQRDTMSKPLLNLVRSWLPRVKVSIPKVTAALDAWDGRVDRDRPEPLIATLWMERVAQQLLRPQMNESFDDWWFWDDQALQRLLADPKWCATVTVPDRTCDDVLGQALQQAAGELTERLGPNVADWRWGELHRMHFRHPIFRYVPVIGGKLDPNLPTDGDAFSLNRGVPLGNPDSPDLPDVHGPTMRLVVDLKDPMQAVVNLAGGQSGNPFSPHYADGLPDWRDGTYRPIVDSSVHTLTLKPGS